MLKTKTLRNFRDLEQYGISLLTTGEFAKVRETFTRRYPHSWHIWIRSGTARDGLRNQHDFTGRVD